MYGSRSKILSKKSRPCVYDVKFLALLGAPYIYDISRLRDERIWWGNLRKRNHWGDTGVYGK
jgi:hypothetical protein